MVLYILGILESSNMDLTELGSHQITPEITITWERTAMITHKVAKRARMF